MIGAARTTLFQFAEPLLTIGTTFLFLGQTLAPVQILGVVIVIGALFWASLRGRPAA